MATKQTPTVGRIVDFQIRPGVMRPAIIVSVNNETSMNLQVFTDAGNDGLDNVVWRTSVAEGTLEGQWAWPTKV